MPCNSFSSAEALTRQFYEWERRGRGWQVFRQPVAPEPPFRPFFGHFVSTRPGAIADDGRKPTFFSSLFGGLLGGQNTPTGAATPPDEGEPVPVYLEDRTALVELQAVLPADTKIGKDAAGQFLMS